MDKFKFCSVMSEDTLEFYLEYFPELKKKGVHQIKGNSLPDVSRSYTRCSVSDWPPGGAVVSCPLEPRVSWVQTYYLSHIRSVCLCSP